MNSFFILFFTGKINFCFYLLVMTVTIVNISKLSFNVNIVKYVWKMYYHSNVNICENVTH